MDWAIRIAALTGFGGILLWFVQLCGYQYRSLRITEKQTELERQLLLERIALVSQKCKFEQERAALAWNGWRKFQVVAKKLECDDVYSFYLAAIDGKQLPPFLPGQYLTFQLNIPRQSKPVIRCYSLSDSFNNEYYRVTIKRVPPPSDNREAPPGLASNHFHQNVNVGDILDVKAPSGSFVLDPQADRTAVLISGGVGITPMFSMASTLAASGMNRKVWFFHGARNQSDHIMKRPVEHLASRHKNFNHVICYSQPTVEDRLGEDYHVNGRLTVEVMKSRLRTSNHDFYICGPPAMMSGITEGLRAWGVPDNRVFFEAFGPASVKRVGGAEKASSSATDLPVVFARAGKTCNWSSQTASLLDLAEANGIAIGSGCRAGNCGSCIVTVKSGRTKNLHEPGFQAEAGSCLACIAIPETALTVDA